MRIGIIGGGAAGYFVAANLNNRKGNHEIILFEQSNKVLQKVAISGGGRCNVTHACWEPQILVGHYPRGEKELLGPFHHFACGDTMAWFEERGVSLKIEEDGRVFPVSDDSISIIQCLQNEVQKNHVQLKLKHQWKGWMAHEIEGKRKYDLFFHNQPDYQVDIVIITTGSQPKSWRTLTTQNFECISPVPSLFTFNIQNKALHQLAGTSVNHARVQILNKNIEISEGPVLITHWGLSGPAILKLSAFGAIELAKLKYVFEMIIAWIPDLDLDQWKSDLIQHHGKKQIKSIRWKEFSQRLWHYFLKRAKVAENSLVSQLSKKDWQLIYDVLTKDRYAVTGKSTFKAEFVTAGGVELRQINFKNFESKENPKVYFSGEVLNIDAVTGGFNFQNAWTGSYLIAGDINQRYLDE